MEHGLESKLFEKFSHVYSGHYHTRSTDGRIFYLGNPYEMFWSDVEDPRGFTILDTESMEITHVDNPHRLFFNIYYEDTNYKLFDTTKYKNKIVKVIVKKKTNAKQFDKFLDKLYASDVEEIKIVENFNFVGGDDVEDEERRQHEARQEGGGEQRFDRGFRHQPVEDQHDRRRDHGAQAARGTDGPDGQVLVIAQPQHLRQRDQTQQHDLTADDPGHRRHDHCHQGGNDGDPATHLRQPEVQRVVHFLGNAGALQKRRHENEQWNGYEHILGEQVENLLRQDIKRSGARPSGQ